MNVFPIAVQCTASTLLRAAAEVKIGRTCMHVYASYIRILYMSGDMCIYMCV